MSFQLHGELKVLQPFRRIELIVHIAISVLPGTHFYLSQVKNFRPRTQHRNNVPKLRGEKHDISSKILHQAGFETARQAATARKRNALAVAPCPCQSYFRNSTFGYTYSGYCSPSNRGLLENRESIPTNNSLSFFSLSVKEKERHLIDLHIYQFFS